VPEPQRPECRDAQRHGTGDVAERVAALVAVGARIRQFADANAVEDDEDDAGERDQG